MPISRWFNRNKRTLADVEDQLVAEHHGSPDPIVASGLCRARPGAYAREHSEDQQRSNDCDGFNDARSVKSTARHAP